MAGGRKRERQARFLFLSKATNLDTTICDKTFILQLTNGTKHDQASYKKGHRETHKDIELEVIHSPPHPPLQAILKTEMACGSASKKHTLKWTRTITTSEMQHCLKNSDYIPDNILLLYYDAHMLPIRYRVYAANRDQQFCGILHYLEMFCSCLDKREKDQN